MIRRLRFGFRGSLIALLLAVSCVTQTYHMAPLADQSVELSSPELCRIYVLRSAESRVSRAPLLVFDGEMQIGAFTAREFVCWERRPGPLHLTVMHVLPKEDGGNRQEFIDLSPAAGEIHFLGVTLAETGSTPTIRALEPAEARELLVELQPPQTL